MKIQLKRSNVLEGGVAKEPTAGQMEYGEIAVNYNSSDPVLFIKDSSNSIIRITDSAEDGQINVNAGEGLTATGNNATANQAVNTTRTLAIDLTWLANWAAANVFPANDGQININAGTGLSASGDNATADQSSNTTRVLAIDESWLNSWATANVFPANDGEINIEAGDGLTATGSNATADQTANTTRTLSAVGDAGYGIDSTASGLRLSGNWSNLPVLT